jgi:acyl-ACP thioesterase
MIMSRTLQSRQRYQVNISDTGPQNKLTVASLWNYMQETAWNNAAYLGFSVYDLHKRGITWVVYRLKLSIESYPRHGENFTVETWPSGLDKYFVYRDFRVYDHQDQVIGEATSTWLVLDLKKRTLITDLHKDLLGLYSGQDVAYLPRATDKLRKISTTEIEKPVTVEWFDLDVNEHANNSFFIRWVAQSVPSVCIRNYDLHVLDIQFKKECSYGDSVMVRSADAGESTYLHEMVKSSGDIAVLAQSTWR